MKERTLDERLTLNLGERLDWQLKLQRNVQLTESVIHFSQRIPCHFMWNSYLTLISHFKQLYELLWNDTLMAKMSMQDKSSHFIRECPVAEVTNKTRNYLRYQHNSLSLSEPHPVFPELSSFEDSLSRNMLIHCSVELDSLCKKISQTSTSNVNFLHILCGRKNKFLVLKQNWPNLKHRQAPSTVCFRLRIMMSTKREKRIKKIADTSSCLILRQE